MPIISSQLQMLYNVSVVGCIAFAFIIAMFPQSIKLAIAIKKQKSLVILVKNDSGFEIVEASHKENLWEVSGDRKGELRGIFESKPDNAGRLFNRPAMIAYETITPSINAKACVLVRHLREKLGITTWTEYEALKAWYMKTRNALVEEMKGDTNKCSDTDSYKAMSETDRLTFSYFDALWTNGYFPDVIEPMRLQDMERFLKYYHDPKSYVVRERNAVSVARAQAMTPEKFNLTKWIIIGGIIVVAFMLFSGSGDTSTAESAYAVSNPLSSYLPGT